VLMAESVGIAVIFLKNPLFERSLIKSYKLRTRRT